jgi:hypothetical protein
LFCKDEKSYLTLILKRNILKGGKPPPWLHLTTKTHHSKNKLLFVIYFSGQVTPPPPAGTPRNAPKKIVNAK